MGKTGPISIRRYQTVYAKKNNCVQYHRAYPAGAVRVSASLALLLLGDFLFT
jgi:hypothetical protein